LGRASGGTWGEGSPQTPATHGAGGYEAGGYEAGGYEAGGYEAGGYEAGGYEAGGYEAGGYEGRRRTDLVTRTSTDPAPTCVQRDCAGWNVVSPGATAVAVGFQRGSL